VNKITHFKLSRKREVKNIKLQDKEPVSNTDQKSNCRTNNFNLIKEKEKDLKEKENSKSRIKE